MATYLLTYFWRPQAGRHMFPPDALICLQRSQLSRVSCPGVSAQCVDKVGLWSVSSSLSVGWLPEYQLVSSQLRVPEAVSRKP